MKKTFAPLWIGWFCAVLLMGLPVIASSAPEPGAAPPKTTLADLPQHILPIQGKMTLIADFQNKKDGLVSLYLINATKVDVVIPTQGGDLYCKREAQATDGAWRRCDSHQYSWCGNSYMATNLRAGEFLNWQQKCDSGKGAARIIRFRLFQNAPLDLESNEGSGTVDDTEIQTCRYDAMAMQDGPFEDIAAVATGKVKGGQGASIDGMEDALQALKRFPQEKRLFPVLQEVIAKFAATPDSNGYYVRYYQTCLEALERTLDVSLSRLDCWNYVASQINDAGFPWSNEALEWLIKSFRSENQLIPFVRGVLLHPRHGAMRAAVFGYGNLVGKHEAGKRLASIAGDGTYSQLDRRWAREAREGLYPNPFVNIRVIDGDWLNAANPVPLTLVSIENISPQSIMLPGGNADSLLVICLQAGDGTEIQLSGASAIAAGEQQLKPGGSIEIRDFKWWSRLNPEDLKSDENYNVSLHAASPGMWEVNAKANWSSSVKGQEILKALASLKGK